MDFEKGSQKLQIGWKQEAFGANDYMFYVTYL